MIRIVYISDFLNHHQLPLAKEFYRLTNGNYQFIETEPMPESFKKSGYPTFDAFPFVISSWRSTTERQMACDVIDDADVVVFENLSFIDSIKKRLRQHKLTFECSERWLKKGLLNLLSPRLIKSQWLYHTFFYNKPIYRLCSSAYLASDLKLMRSYVGRCYKWGYFVEVNDLDLADIIQQREKLPKFRFISIGRLINWKQHDTSIRAASILRNKGYDFEINIYGSGPEREKLLKLINQSGLKNHVFLKGNISNDSIIEELRIHHALIFPSSRREGWGAVVNEAMANACPVIGSSAAGSVPYLIDDNVTGLFFPSGNYVELAEKMEKFMCNQDLRTLLSKNAYSKIVTEWSPVCAADNFIKLSNSLLSLNKSCAITQGPCSLA